MRLLKIGGIDPSLRNFGLAKALYDIQLDTFEIVEIDLISTEKKSGKTIRSSSDDLRCATQLVAGTQKFIKDCAAVCAEVPSGAQSARAAFGLGIAVGVLGSVGAVGPKDGFAGGFEGRLVQTNPQDVKRLAVGSKVAAKEEMIEWAAERWPDLPWLTDPRGTIIVSGKKLQAKNEHMADACAAINAGVQTDEFLSLVQMFRAMDRQAQNVGSSSNS